MSIEAPVDKRPSAKPLYLLVDFTGQTAFTRGVTAGVARFCHERQDVKLRFSSIEWGLVTDPNNIDGVIAIVGADDPNHPATRFGKPVVNVSSICHPVPFPTVTMDNHAIGQLAAEHLLHQGYQHFAYLLESRVYFSRRRLVGFRDFLDAKGHSCAVFDTASLDVTGAVLTEEEARQDLRRRTERWLLDLPKSCGLFTHSDVRAAMVLDICRQAGMSVPEQVGLVGVDNDELVYPFCIPPLSDIDIAPDLVGYRAAEVLVDLIDGKLPPRAPILIRPRKMYERGSSQPQHLDDEILAAALQFMRQNVNRGLSMAKLLEAVPVTRRSLERRFRDTLRTSPAQAIRRIQIERASDLLTNTNQPLPRIALAVGYTRFRNFATAFKRETGLTPAAYRRKFHA